MKTTLIVHVALRLMAVIVISPLISCASMHEAQNIPYMMARNVPLIGAEIGSSGPLLFLVDTGVDPSVIDLETARRLNISVDESEVGEAEGSGDGDGLIVMRSSIEGLNINGDVYEPIDALAADLTSFSGALGVDLAGILGYSLLSERVLRIDYRAQEISIASKIEHLPPPTTNVVRRHSVLLRFNSVDDRIPVFEISIEGTSVVVSLDTGKSSGIEFYETVVRRLDLEKHVEAGDGKQRLGARGARKVRTGELPSITLGPFIVKNASASFSDKAPVGELREGNAGNRFLQNFVVTIDYVNRRIIFEK